MPAWQPDPLTWIDTELARLERDGLRRRLLVREGPRGARITIAGTALIDFSSNDYLGLASDPRLAAAAGETMAAGGWGSGASPLITGRATAQAELETEIARFEGTEAALVFPSGFAANSGTIAALVGKNDVIFSDAKNHASIIDGCRLSSATCFIYPHRDCDALDQLLSQSTAKGRRLIVTDSLFSMDGNLAPIEKLVDLATDYQAMLMVDEAHATGVFGRRGRGVVEHVAQQTGRVDLEQKVQIRVGTLSKALGSTGGFVSGSQKLIDWLLNRARAYAFSTAQPEAASAASRAAIHIVETAPKLRKALLKRASYFRQEASKLGWNTGDSVSQIVPLMVGSAKSAIEISAALQNAGFFVPAIRPPTVPPGESLLRVSLSTSHTPEMIDQLLATLAHLGP